MNNTQQVFLKVIYLQELVLAAVVESPSYGLKVPKVQRRGGAVKDLLENAKTTIVPLP